MFQGVSLFGIPESKKRVLMKTRTFSTDEIYFSLSKTGIVIGKMSFAGRLF